MPFALLLKAQYGDACTTEAVHKELKQIKTHISRSETEATLTQY